MKSLSKLALCLLLAMSLTVSAFAAQVPDSLVAENLNGQQRLVKTYTLSPEVDPDELKEEDFSYDGYLYTWAYTTKVEHPYLESKTVMETVTVNTAKNDLAQILAELSPSMPYEKDGFSGELALDHTTLSTEASGYTTKYSKTTETKVIGNLDRNDMSYVPATTVKTEKRSPLPMWNGRSPARRLSARRWFLPSIRRSLPIPPPTVIRLPQAMSPRRNITEPLLRKAWTASLIPWFTPEVRSSP